MSAKHTPGAKMVITDEVLIAQLSAEIDKSLLEFQKHSETCKTCRSPVRVYQARQRLCDTGHKICVRTTELLYRKASLVPKGTFQVEYKQGWEAVDGLIRMICHANQGELTNKVIDLKRAVPKESLRERPKENAKIEYVRPHHPAEPANTRRGYGSAYTEDMRRVQQPDDRHKTDASRRDTRDHRRHSHHHHTRPHSPNRRGGPHRQADIYGDAHTSFLSVPEGQRQASTASGSSAGSGSAGSSPKAKSVHFNPLAEVREFDDQRP